MEQSVINKLMELKKLYEAGILTKEELEAEKQKVLGSEAAEDTPQKQHEAVVQETASTSANPEEKHSNKALWSGIGFGVLVLALIILGITLNNKKAEPLPNYDIDAMEDIVEEDYLTSDTYTEVTPYEEEFAEVGKRASNVPKPQHTQKSNLPFNPSGCPYVYIMGSDQEAMHNNKSIICKVYGREYVFRIGYDHPFGTNIDVVSSNSFQNLFNDIPEDEDVSTFFEYGDLREDCSMQITIVDFNDDDECEVLLTLQREPIDLKTYIFKLLPNPSPGVLAKYLGCIDGQTTMYLDGTHIVVPYGSHGLYDEYILTPNGEIVQLELFS